MRPYFPWTMVSGAWLVAALASAPSPVGEILCAASVWACWTTGRRSQEAYFSSRERGVLSLLLLLGPLTPFWVDGLGNALAWSTNVDGSSLYVLLGPILAVVSILQIASLWFAPGQRV